jgi:hypothetical protein
MTQPNQYSFTRSQIRRLARSGGLTADVIARIEDAVKRGQVINDIGGQKVPAPQPLKPPQTAGTEIPAQKIEARRPWW